MIRFQFCHVIPLTIAEKFLTPQDKQGFPLYSVSVDKSYYQTERIDRNLN